MDNIKLKYQPKLEDYIKKNPPTLLLYIVLPCRMPVSSFEKAGSTSVKKLSDPARSSFICCCFRSVSNPLNLKFLKIPNRN